MNLRAWVMGLALAGGFLASGCNRNRQEAILLANQGDNYVDTNPADAIQKYEEAVRLQPDHWRAMKGIGVILDRMGRPNEATAAYQRAREAQRR